MSTSGSSLASRLALSAFGFAVLIGACVRDPLTADCPELAAGELVVTEIFKDTDTHAWIELFNPTDRELALAGLRVSVLPLTGEVDKIWAFTVRDPDARVAPGRYVVLGQGDPRFYDFIDYDFIDDKSAAPEPEGKLEVQACDDVIDAVIYRSLPGDAEPLEGPAALALDGARPPTSDDNDDTDQRWCLDGTPFQSAPDKQATVGSPGEANPPCSF